MGDPNVKPELTTYDKVSVVLYRSGIVAAALCLLYGVTFFFHVLFEVTLPFFIAGPNHLIVFWIFVISVSISTAFLHLYSRQLLNGIRAFAALGVAILLIRHLTGEGGVEYIIYRQGLSGKAGIIGWGFIMAAFSGIGAKEAFCFRLREGYAYAILSALLVLGHLFGLLSAGFAFLLLLLIVLLVVVFTFRKLRLPMYYDIGDKSKY